MEPRTYEMSIRGMLMSDTDPFRNGTDCCCIVHTSHLSTYSVGFIDTGNGGGTEFPIWIVAAIAVVAIAGIGGAVFLKKRKA